jgi:hypothetical protein
MPFWNQLRSLSLNLPYHQSNEVLLTLRDRLPPSLEELRLVANHSPVQLADADSFFERLAEVPLRSLELRWIPVRAAALDRLLGTGSRSELQSLTLNGCRLAEEHAEILARSERIQQLWSLELNDLSAAPAAAAEVIKNLKNIRHLRVSLPAQGWAVLEALAEAKDLSRLRSLDINVSGVPRPFLQRLLASPNLRQLARLEINDSGLTMVIDRAVAAQLVGLPSLANLLLTVGKLEEDARKILNSSDTLAWSRHRTEDHPESFALTGSSYPPLDDDLVAQDIGY